MTVDRRNHILKGSLGLILEILLKGGPEDIKALKIFQERSEKKA